MMFSTVGKRRSGANLRALCIGLAAFALLGATASEPSPQLSQNLQAERIFERAKAAWQSRSDFPYLHYGALVRYLHNGHVFDNWWDAYYRTTDGAFSLKPLVDDNEEKRRLAGVPVSLLGVVTMYDSNRNSEPIHLDPPKISPIASFGIAGRTQISIVPPNPSPSSALRTIGSVTANTRDYRVDLIGAETLLGTSTFHLKLTPLHDPKIYRLRDLWVDPQTFRTVELRVQGLLHGEPYDRVEWTVRYVELRGRNYVQQITADGPLRFGLNTVIPTFEFDFVDYHYPSEVPKYTFDRPF